LAHPGDSLRSTAATAYGIVRPSWTMTFGRLFEIRI
jgi:hypothetical protein